MDPLIKCHVSKRHMSCDMHQEEMNQKLIEHKTQKASTKEGSAKDMRGVAETYETTNKQIMCDV